MPLRYNAPQSSQLKSPSPLQPKHSKFVRTLRTTPPHPKLSLLEKPTSAHSTPKPHTHNTPQISQLPLSSAPETTYICKPYMKKNGLKNDTNPKTMSFGGSPILRRDPACGCVRKREETPQNLAIV